MVQEHLIAFGPFHLETSQGRLWRGEQVIPLRRRSFALLQYLAAHPDRLVTKAELREHIWLGMHVSDTVLRVCIREIRAALGDTAEAPQYLKTISGQGYRFLMPGERHLFPPIVTGPILVGRQHEVDTLATCFQDAARGNRQIVFLSGEAGVGKTTVLDLWLSRLVAASAVWLGRGQCSEHYGEGEAYLPLLDALGRLGHGPRGHALVEVLRRCAPMWLTQLPGLLSDADLERVQRQVQGAAQARMIRELAEALEVLTTDTPLVLVLEDLHWSDTATLAFLTFLAQRREPARLMVVGTYRPLETAIHAHPLRSMVQELRGRGQGVELPVELLPAEDVAAYAAGRLGGPVTSALCGFIYAHTEGNALFMVHIVEHLLEQELVRQQDGQWRLLEGAEVKLASVPESLRQLLLRRIEELTPAARHVLEVASVVGLTFEAAAVAAGAQCGVEEIESVCEELASRQHFIDDRELTVWPDGTSRGSYRFRHALYPQVLYGCLSSVRRRQLHQCIGERLAAGYGEQSAGIAAQLAIHFERGGEPLRAVNYLEQMADTDTERNAHHEAVVILSKGLELLQTLPESAERTQRELALLLVLGQLLMTVKGHGALEVGEVYTRANRLCQALGEPRQRCEVLQGLYRFHLAQAQFRMADELIQQFFRLTPHQHGSTLLQEGSIDLGLMAFYQGEQSSARAHLEQSLHLSDVQHPSRLLFSGGHEAQVTTLLFLSITLGMQGFADQALLRGQEALLRAQQVGHSPSLIWAQLLAAIRSQHRRDVAATQTYAEALVALAATQGFERYVEHGRILQGWALAMQGDAAKGVAYIQQGLVVVQRTGLKLYRPYYLTLLAEAYGQAKQPEAGLSVLDEALTLIEATEERWWEAELYRLKGALLLYLPRPDITQVTSCFHQAIEVARRQQAKALELRATLSLSQLWQQHGQQDQARQLLTEVYSWFTEGFETPDLQEARRRLEAST
jgi:predicted ATPase/DNA-binding winged helix-turn-helix (wHTH) protein